MDYKLLFIDETDFTEADILSWLISTHNTQLNDLARQGQCTLSLYAHQLCPALKRKMAILAVSECGIEAVLTWQEHSPVHIALMSDLIPKQPWGAQLLNTMWQKIVNIRYPGPTISSLHPHHDHVTQLHSMGWHQSTSQSMYQNSGQMAKAFEKPPGQGASIGISHYSYEYAINQESPPDMLYFVAPMIQNGATADPAQQWLYHFPHARTHLAECYVSLYINGKPLTNSETDQTPLAGKAMDLFYSGFTCLHHHLCISPITENMLKDHAKKWWHLAMSDHKPSVISLFTAPSHMSTIDTLIPASQPQPGESYDLSTHVRQ